MRLAGAAVALGLATGMTPAATLDFGPNVVIFDPSMPTAQIQEQINALWNVQGSTEMGTGRTAFLFKPGTYDVDVPVGFYTQVMGLGSTPDKVNITGNLHANPMRGNMALVTFWRSAENVAITPNDGTVRWIVSQAAPIRRLHVKGNLAYNDEGSWGSGGYTSDTLVDGKTDGRQQQQWINRNVEWKSWEGSFLNMFFMGVVNPPPGEWPEVPYTSIAATPIIREKPFLEVNDKGDFFVRVPPLRKDSKGISWRDEKNLGQLIPISKFYIAKPTDNVASINAALDKGLGIIFTPGIYDIDAPLKVTRANTIVMGLGFATLRASKGNVVMCTADVGGISISSILFDAGPQLSPALLEVGSEGSKVRHASNPNIMSDVFFRVGGIGPAAVKSDFVINANDTIVDHTWIWRADHGSGSGWATNPSANGLVVNGNNVTIYGLFVEHHQQYQTLWNGDGGRVYFYQCEIPYDPPSQAAYSAGPGMNGWAAYKVADKVNTHEAVAMGVYSVFRVKGVILDRAYEAPDKPGIKFHNMLTLCINGQGEISNVINNDSHKTVGGMKVDREAGKLTGGFARTLYFPKPNK